MARCVLFPHYPNYNEQIKGPVHFKCAICIWNLLLSTVKMRSKELSLSVKQAIIRLKKQNKPIREIAKTLGVAKTTVWNILKKKERTGELSNTKRPGRPRKTTVVDDRRILSLVKDSPVYQFVFLLLEWRWFRLLQSESQFDCFSLLCCCAVCDCSSAFLLNLYLTFTLLFKVIIYNLIPTIFLVLSIKLIWSLA